MEFKRGTTDLREHLSRLLNGGLSLEDNFSGAFLDEELDEGENELFHGLGYTPIGYIVLYKREQGDIYGARRDEWTTERLFLRSSVPSQKATLFVV